MKNKNFDPFENLKLDEFEQAIEDALEQKEYVSGSNFEDTKKMFEEAAKRHIELQESKSITLRVKNVDLIKVKAKAKRSGIAYQTLIGLLIRQYVEGETKMTL